MCNRRQRANTAGAYNHLLRCRGARGNRWKPLFLAENNNLCPRGNHSHPKASYMSQIDKLISRAKVRCPRALEVNEKGGLSRRFPFFSLSFAWTKQRPIQQNKIESSTAPHVYGRANWSPSTLSFPQKQSMCFFHPLSHTKIHRPI